MPGGWGVLGVAVAAPLALAVLWVGSRRRFPRGRGGLLSMAARPPRSVRACGAGVWDTAWQRACAPARTATEELLRVVRDEIQGGHEDAAVAHWLELVAAGLDAHAEPALAIHAAALLRDRGRSDEAAGALRAALRASGGSTGLAVAVRVAHAAADLDPRLARDAAWRALGSHELALLDRQDLERLIAKLEPGERLGPSEKPLRASESPAPFDP